MELFGRFSVLARRVVVRAVDHARALGEARVGAEHVLLALVSEDGPFSGTLRGAGLTPQAVGARLTGGKPLPPAPEGPREPLGPEEVADLQRRLRGQGLPRQRILQLVDQIQRERTGLLELDETAKQILEEAVLRAEERVGTGHVLSALLSEPSLPLLEIFDAVGVDPESLQRLVKEAWHDDPA